MGWSNYLVNEKEKIAIEIGKFNIGDYDEETTKAYDELMEYLGSMDSEEGSPDVIRYLLRKIGFVDSQEFMVSKLIEWLGEGWTIKHEYEEDFNLENYKVVSS